MNRPIKRVDFVRNYLDGIFAEDLHAKRVESLANGALGVMTSASLAGFIRGGDLLIPLIKAHGQQITSSAGQRHRSIPVLVRSF